MATLTIYRTSAEGRKRIKQNEGYSLRAYLDTASPPVPTIGYGHAATNARPARGMLNGEFYEGSVVSGLVITAEEADRLFNEDLNEVEHAVSRLLKHPPTAAQFDALTDFAHHFGVSRLQGSTLLKMVNDNPANERAICYEFSRWHIAGGKRDEALYRRAVRRAFTYCGEPIPPELWKKNGIAFAVTPDDKWDEANTLMAHDAVKLARAGRPLVLAPPEPMEAIPVFEAPPEPKPAKPSPAATPAPAAPSVKEPEKIEHVAPVVSKSEPIVNTPSPQAPAGKGAEPVALPPNPGPPVPLPPPPPKTVTIITDAPKPPKEPVIIQPKTVDVNAIVYGKIDPANGAKNMTDSQRGIGLVIVGLGSVVQVVMTRAGIGGIMGAVFYDLSRDPVVVGLAATGVVVAIGWLTRKRGTKVMTKGMVEAQHLLK